jgi:hypothetical protein
VNPRQDERIFFYCCPSGPPEDADYQHLIVYLAEGLKKLGATFYSNNNYWRLDPKENDYLLQCNSEINHHDCTIVVLEQQWCRKQGLPRDLFDSRRKYITVLLDSEDRVTTISWLPEFRQFDIIFKTHYTQNIQQPSNFYPWAFGLSERVLRETNSPLDFSKRKGKFLINFRHHPILGAHPVRRYIEKKFVPRIQNALPVDHSLDPQNEPPSDPYHYLQWAQSGRRHYPNYFKRLQETTACAAFGGFFFPPLVQNPATLSSKLLNKLWVKSGLKSNRIIQWDSWRFWESLAAGCATFHVDFEKYGLLLPVMPQNWLHYIGVDLDDVQATVDRLAEEPEILEEIGISGRAWAISNYGPEAVATRFLETVQQIRNDHL